MWEYKLLFMEKGLGDIMIAPKYECITTRLFNERFAKIGSGKEYNIKNKEIISNVDVRTNIFKK